MFNKKLIATLCAVATTVASLFAGTPVFAAESISGNAVYIDKTKYVLTLPTTAGYKLVLDPQGLVTGKTAGSTWSAGQEGSVYFVVPKDASGNAIDIEAKNDSSVPVYLETKMWITGDDLVTDLASSNAIAASTNAVLFNVKLTDNKGAGKEASACEITAEASGNGVSINGVSTNAITVKMPKAHYTFSKKAGASDNSIDVNDYQYTETAKTNSGVKFALTGYCAKDADWSAYSGSGATKALQLNTVFKFFKADKTGSKSTEEASNPAPAVADAAPSIATTSYTMVASTPVNITVNLGSGTLAATTVSSVKWGAVELLDGTMATYSNGVVTIALSSIDYLRTLETTSNAITVIFDEGTEIGVTLNK